MGGDSMQKIQNKQTIDKTKRQALEKRLFEHRKNKSTIKLLEAKLQQLDLQLYYDRQRSGETKEECLEGMSIKAHVVTGMPFSETNKFSSIVENVALSEKREETINKFDKDIILQEVNSIINVLVGLKRRVEEIDNLLECLGDKHRFIIEKYYIAKIENNYEVAIIFSREFQKPISYISVKRLKHEALQELLLCIV
jgi:hypothetical protein